MEIKPLFFTNVFQQRRALNLLLEESKTDYSFYLFLVVSAFLTTLGLLLDSPVIIIGGMLVAPLLFPVLLIGMGVATASGPVIRRALLAILKSTLIVAGVSFATAFLLDSREVTAQMQIASSPNLLYSLAAFAAGIIGAYAWARENIATHIPAIAVTVALIPPLSVAGIALSLFSRELFSGGFTLFLINIIGVSAACVIVFSLFGYSRLQEVAEKKVETEKKEEALKKKEKTDQEENV